VLAHLLGLSRKLWVLVHASKNGNHRPVTDGFGAAGAWQEAGGAVRVLGQVATRFDGVANVMYVVP
jgi:hypothetical protein